jgi:coenzyme F420-0:L-glutamate ligase/coenzyme F420-1:gamma-L-glutamate ligase
MKIILSTLPNIPLVNPGDNLASLIAGSVQQTELTLSNNDIVVIAQKIVSKAEGCFVDLTKVTPSTQALELAELTGKPAALIEVILWDTAEIIRAKKDLLIVEHLLGFISANAGIDHSNVSSEPNIVLRLPQNPDMSAQAIRQDLEKLLGVKPPVLIIDSHGRTWRYGTVGVVIGLSGIAPVENLQGEIDLFGYQLQHTEVGLTDQVAAAASLLMGQAGEGCPVVVVRGASFVVDEQAKSTDVLRPKEMDLFR